MSRDGDENRTAFSVFAFAFAADWRGRAPDWPDQPAPEASSTPLVTPAGAGDVAVICQRLDPADYTGDAGERHLQDLQWLLPRAEYHQSVVSAAAEVGALLPVRFGTIFSDRAALEAWVEPRNAALADALESLRGRSEWAIRLLAADRPSGGDKATAEDSGRSYLLARKSARDAEGQRHRELERAADELEKKLASIFVGITKLGVRNVDKSLRRADGDTRTVVANWSALADRDSEVPLTDIEEAARALGLDVEMTGPWPPYNFCPNFD
ncbi:MAG: GvpL/GvpF family gas vesicle protein [Acidobacteriota bacterium]